MGFSIVHVYGLTETLGPYSVVPVAAPVGRARPGAAGPAAGPQGVGMIEAERMRVVEIALPDEELVDVPADGGPWARSSCAATTS